MAERVGFEPTVGCPTAVFKTAALDHSATSPAGPIWRGWGSAAREKRSCRWWSGVELGEFGESGHEGVEVEGFDEVIVKAGGVGFCAVARLSPASGGDDGDVRAVGELAQAAADFEAIHGGHAEVEEDDMG